MVQAPDSSCSAHVLIVDDHPGLDGLVPRALRRHGFITTVVVNVAGLDRILARLPTDLVILDLKSSSEALSICRRLAAKNGPPVIVLDRAASEAERIATLEADAEYLVSRPWNPRVFLAHVHAILRRGAHSLVDVPNERIYDFLGWRFDLATHELTDPNGRLVNLTPGEFALLRAFVERPRRMLTRKDLLEAMDQGDGPDRKIDVLLSRLRRKLEHENIIRTVRSGGYVFLPQFERTPEPSGGSSATCS